MSGKSFLPGTRVVVFDPRLYKDDFSTPLSITMRPATVMKWYGRRSPRFGIYPSLIDVEFDHRPDTVSEGHFTDHLKVIEE